MLTNVFKHHGQEILIWE